MSPSPVDILKCADTVEFLKEVHAQKRRRNSQLSIRGLAGVLGVPASTLAAIMARTRRISGPLAKEIASKLGLPELEADYFSLLAELDPALGTESEAAIRTKLKELAWLIEAGRRETTELNFEPEWFHLALTEWGSRHESLTAEEFAHFAAQIGIDSEAAKRTLLTLLGQGVFRRREDGRYERVANRILLTSTVSNATFRRVHTDVTKRALEAIECQSPTTRYSVSEFVTFDESGFREFKTLTNQYLDRAQYQSNQIKDAEKLYCISLHAFQLPIDGDRHD